MSSLYVKASSKWNGLAHFVIASVSQKSWALQQLNDEKPNRKQMNIKRNQTNESLGKVKRGSEMKRRERRIGKDGNGDTAGA